MEGGGYLEAMKRHKRAIQVLPIAAALVLTIILGGCTEAQDARLCNLQFASTARCEGDTLPDGSPLFEIREIKVTDVSMYCYECEIMAIRIREEYEWLEDLDGRLVRPEEIILCIPR